MKKVFKNKSYHKPKLMSKIISFTVILIGVITFFLVKNFSKNTNQVLIDTASSEINKVLYNFLNTKINHEILNKESLDNILDIYQNSEGEILTVNFNLDKAYLVLDEVSLVLTDSLKDIEGGSIAVGFQDQELSHTTNSLILNIPVGNSLKSMYFFNIGPKVPVKINFVGTVLTNLETKITNYGLNNALVEVFVYMEFHQQIITPFESKDISFKYDAVIASKMIQGKVPAFYGGSIERLSSVYEKNI